MAAASVLAALFGSPWQPAQSPLNNFVPAIKFSSVGAIGFARCGARRAAIFCGHSTRRAVYPEPRRAIPQQPNHLQVILDILNQYAIMGLLIRHDSRCPRTMRLPPAVLLSAHAPDPRLRPATPLESTP